MARHPDVVAAVLGSGRTKARSQLVELEKKLPALNREITQMTQQMNNVVDALAKGGLVVLDDELRGRVEDLRRRKDELLIKREHLEQDGEVLRQEQLAPDKICAALARFDTSWEQMSPEEKRELVELTVARVELRRSAKGEDAMEARPRGLQMQFQLHLPELLVSDGDGDFDVKEEAPDN